MESIDHPYQVRLDKFEGPLDLLLHLIKKNEINIYDIPIALITGQYLEYVSAMRSLNLAVAGEFLVMAATLIQIKSRMLLPADETEDDEEDGPDPREELVRRLLEYKQFKDAAAQLDDRERVWREIFSKAPDASIPVRTQELNLDQVTLFDLVDALHGLLARLPTGDIGEIAPEQLTVRDRMNAIIEELEGKESVTFLALFEGQPSRLAAIVTFLALLELVRIQVARVFQGETFGPILVMRTYSPIQGEDLVVGANAGIGDQEDDTNGCAT